MFCACVKPADTTGALSIEWQKNRATGLIISRALLGDIGTDSIRTLLHIHLARGADEPPVFGGYFITADSVIFRPLIPFTPGLEYDVRLSTRSLGKVKIPLLPADAPAVVAVFPSSDTLPENLLKFIYSSASPYAKVRPPCTFS